MRKFLAFVFTLALTTGAYAFCNGSPCGGGMGGGSKANYQMFEALWSLDLNEDQEGKLDAIIKNYRKTMIDLEDLQFDSARVVGFEQNKFDRKAFVKNKVTPHEKLVNAHADLFEGIHKVLTPAQRVEFAGAIASCESNSRSCGPNKRSCGSKNKGGNKQGGGQKGQGMNQGQGMNRQ